jgi:branched-subunit amino acid ABC-type transport system permease component
MGVDANRVIIATFALGAALAAVAGVMWGANYASIQFAMGFVPGLKAFSRRCWAASAISTAPCWAASCWA